MIVQTLLLGYSECGMYTRDDTSNGKANFSQQKDHLGNLVNSLDPCQFYWKAPTPATKQMCALSFNILFEMEPSILVGQLR